MKPLDAGAAERQAAPPVVARVVPPRRTVRSEKAGRERWMVSYADFITLLFAFFVVMYAISSLNDEKYRVLSSTLKAIFDSAPSALDPIPVGEPQLAASDSIIDQSPEPGFKATHDGDTMMRTAKSHAESALGGFADDEGVSVKSNEHWLEISLDSEVAFAPGSASLTAYAQTFLSGLSPYLNSFAHPITVEGFTDNVPTNGTRYPTNWQLASARAAGVVEFLANAGIADERLSAVGYGEQHALATNATPEGRAANRRVVLVVAHTGNLPRNLNTAPATSAFAFVRHEKDATLEGVRSDRTASGGLRFTSESEEE